YNPLIGRLAKQLVGFLAIGLDADAFEIELRKLEARQRVAAPSRVAPIGDGCGKIALAIETACFRHAQEPHSFWVMKCRTALPPQHGFGCKLSVGDLDGASCSIERDAF